MSDDSFLDALAQKLHDFGAELERSVLPTLKVDVHNLKGTYQGLLGLLKKKSLVSDDPYQYSEKISEIKAVPNEPFLESQRQTIISIRMHNFDSQLEFLANYYQFTLDYLTLPRLKAISQLLRFVRWDSLTENAQEMNSRMVAELIGRVRKSDDAISAGLVNDMANQMKTNTAKIAEGLKKVTFYKREEYKHLLRTSFWSGLNLAPEEVSGNSENVQRKIKKEFASHLKGQPYVPDLIKELLDEDFTPGGSALKDELLNKLQTTKVVQEKPTVTVIPGVEMMEAVRTLAGYAGPLESSLHKLEDNALLLDSSQDSLGDRFRRWVRSLMGVKTKQRVFPVEMVDPGTGATRTEQLDFDQFVGECATRVRVLHAVGNKSGPQYQTLLQRGEDEIMAWFERQFIDAAKTVERLNGLDLYFKTETPKERRSQVKGIKAEVAQVRTAMGNANKQRHEAVSRKEEQEQLKRLGIKS